MISGGPKEACVTWGAHLCNLANVIELSVYGGTAAFLSNYLLCFTGYIAGVTVQFELCVNCVAYGVQLSVDGESLSTGDPVIFTEPKVSLSDCRKPDVVNCTI